MLEKQFSHFLKGANTSNNKAQQQMYMRCSHWHDEWCSAKFYPYAIHPVKPSHLHIGIQQHQYAPSSLIPTNY